MSRNILSCMLVMFGLCSIGYCKIQKISAEKQQLQDQLRIVEKKLVAAERQIRLLQRADTQEDLYMEAVISKMEADGMLKRWNEVSTSSYSSECH